MHFNCQSQSCLAINKAALAAKRRIDLQERAAHFSFDLKAIDMLDAKAQTFKHLIHLDESKRLFLELFLEQQHTSRYGAKKKTSFLAESILRALILTLLASFSQQVPKHLMPLLLYVLRDH